MDVVSHDLNGQPHKIGRVIKVDGNDVTLRFYRDHATAMIIKHPDGYEFSLNPIPVVRRSKTMDEAGRQEQAQIMAEIRTDVARQKVYQYIVERLEKTDPVPLFTVYVVWFSSVLKNWKAMVSTTLPDGMYYEVTYNGEKGETYIDAYKKFDNVCIPDEGRIETPVDPFLGKGDAQARVANMNLNPAGPDRFA